MNFAPINRSASSSSWMRACLILLLAVLMSYALFLCMYEAFPVDITPLREVCDPSMYPDEENMQQSNYKIPTSPVSETQFTVLILSNNRTQLLLKCLANFAQMDSVHKIIVTWSNPEAEPPNVQSEIAFKMPVVVKTLRENKLRLRFDAYDEIETEGVLTVDDDLVIQESDINLAFQVWRQHPYGLVGFHRRSHSGCEGGSYRYQYWLELVLRGGYYSMILTGTSFLHRQYLHMFMHHLPPGIADTVDKFFNCEDIAMNFLVQSHCRCAGIFYVKNRYSIQHISHAGLSKKPEHKANRHQCINEFAKYYQTMPLQRVNCRY